MQKVTDSGFNTTNPTALISVISETSKHNENRLVPHVCAVLRALPCIHKDLCREVSRNRIGAGDGAPGRTLWLFVGNHFFTDKLLPCLGWKAKRLRQNCWGPRARPTRGRRGTVLAPQTEGWGHGADAPAEVGAGRQGGRYPATPLPPGRLTSGLSLANPTREQEAGSLGNVAPFETAQQRKDSLDR